MTHRERVLMGRLSYDEALATPFVCRCGRTVAGGAVACASDRRLCPFERQERPTVAVGRWGVLWREEDADA